MLWLAVVVFIVLLLVLVLAHECGHFWAARRAGCRIEEFAFGFPPRLFSFMHGGTRYSFNLLPLGGYVKIEGEDMNESSPGPTSFASKPVPWRIVILAAGVAMNIALAFVLLSWQAVIGIPTLVTEDNVQRLQDLKTYILEVVPNSPAEQAGVMSLDRIVHINTMYDPTLEDVQRVVQESAATEIVLELERRGQHLTVAIVPREQPPSGEGPLGISLAATGLDRVPWWKAPWEGLRRVSSMLIAIITQFGALIGRLAREGTVGEALTGPIGIAVYTNEVTNLGLSYLLEFAALISLNLALINILPFPALDGGRILFVVLEAAMGKRVPIKIEHVVHTLGFLFLILLMLFITLRDIQRLF